MQQAPPTPQDQELVPAAQTQFRIAHAQYSGPIPPPAMLAQYNEIIPNGADRILTMAENQQAHRHALEKSVVDSDIAQSKRGTNTGAFCLVVAYVTSGIIAYTGHDGVAIAISGTVSVVFGGAYAAGLWFRRDSRETKEKTRRELRDRRK